MIHFEDEHFFVSNNLTDVQINLTYGAKIFDFN